MKLDRNDSINFTLRMKTDLRLELAKIAKQENRSLTNLVNTILAEYAKKYEGVKK